MKTPGTQSCNTKSKQGNLPTLIICGVALIAYKLFRSPELDREIEKVARKLAVKHS